jgi:hypothetical protein
VVVAGHLLFDPPAPEDEYSVPCQLFIVDHPGFLENLIQDAEESGRPWFRAHPELMIVAHGLDPADFDLDGFRGRAIPPITSETLRAWEDAHPGAPLAPRRQYGDEVPSEEVMAEFTPEDHEAIERIRAMGFSLGEVVQTYLAAEKRELMAAQWLCDQRNGP